MSYIKFFINFNFILRIIFVVNINVFDTTPLLKYKCWPLKLVIVLMHGWKITQKVKLVEKKSNKGKQIEIKPEKGKPFT